MTTEPYASARTVYWIVDNGSSHAGKTSVKRTQEQWPTARLIHLPVHASWLNQIELYFSIVQRKALTPNDLATLDALAERLLGFGEHYRQIARPFEWTFTREDLNNLITRRSPRSSSSRIAPDQLPKLRVPLALALIALIYLCCAGSKSPSHDDVHHQVDRSA